MQKRLFISLPVDNDWKKIFEDSLVDLDTREWLRFTKSEDLQLTLLFLGQVDEELIPEIEEALSDVTLIVSKFSLTLDKIIYAPEGERATMVWAKFKNDLQLKSLREQVREELAMILGSIEESELLAHITLARFNKNIPPPKDLPMLPHSNHEGEKLTFNEIKLMESKMTKTGSVQVELSSFLFKV